MSKKKDSKRKARDKKKSLARHREANKDFLFDVDWQRSEVARWLEYVKKNPDAQPGIAISNYLRKFGHKI